MTCPRLGSARSKHGLWSLPRDRHGTRQRAAPREKAGAFRAFAEADRKLTQLQVNYEQQEPYKLTQIENPNAQLNLRVEKMKLVGQASRLSHSAKMPETAATAVLRYNDFLTLGGIPPEAYEYRLGNRSALEWVIDQYQVSTDPRSGITNDPNRPDDPEYILRLLGQVIAVSLETGMAMKGLPTL